MTWKPTYQTREQLEERRLEGGRLLKAGKLTQGEVARQLGVSRATVSGWAKKVERISKMVDFGPISCWERTDGSQRRTMGSGGTFTS